MALQCCSWARGLGLCFPPSASDWPDHPRERMYLGLRNFQWGMKLWATSSPYNSWEWVGDPAEWDFGGQCPWQTNLGAARTHLLLIVSLTHLWWFLQDCGLFPREQTGKGLMGWSAAPDTAFELQTLILKYPTLHHMYYILLTLGWHLCWSKWLVWGDDPDSHSRGFWGVLVTLLFSCLGCCT